MPRIFFDPFQNLMLELIESLEGKNVRADILTCSDRCDSENGPVSRDDLYGKLDDLYGKIDAIGPSDRMNLREVLGSLADYLDRYSLDPDSTVVMFFTRGIADDSGIPDIHVQWGDIWRCHRLAVMFDSMWESAYASSLAESDRIIAPPFFSDLYVEIKRQLTEILGQDV